MERGPERDAAAAARRGGRGWASVSPRAGAWVCFSQSAVIALLGACAEHRAAGPLVLDDGAAVAAPTPEAMLDGLMPRTLVVESLTRLEPEEAAAGGGGGAAWSLVLHAELLDQFGHAGKWPGVLVVTLSPHAGGSLEPSEGAEARAEKVWRVDLSTPEKNAAAFDWVTRTYRLRLAGVPEWGAAFGRGERRGTPYLLVRARLETWDGAGRARMVGGEGRIERGE